MARKKKQEAHEGGERWLVSYADFITLLFATFTALFALSNADKAKLEAAAKSIKQAFASPGGPWSTPTVSTSSTGGGGSGAITIAISPLSPSPAAPSAKTSKADKNDKEEAKEDDKDDADSLFRGFSLKKGDGGEEAAAANGEATAAANGEATAAANGGSAAANRGAAAAGGASASTPTPTPTPPAAIIPMGSEGGAGEAMAAEIKELIQNVGLEKVVAVREEKRGTVISLGEAAFFAPGEIDVLPACTHQLDKIVNALRNKSYEIRIEGHTDNSPIHSGRYRDNWELSTLRAASIVHFMEKEYSFDPRSLSAAGYGESRPLVPNDTKENRQKNRRVDIVILNERARAAEPH